MSVEDSGPGLDATLREFASGQKLFNRYALVKTLGRGGMGVVWLARDEELERDVALKFLPDLVVRDRAVLSDMKRETRRSLELTHKNIVRIHDFVYDEKSGCISMEYVDGDTLSNLRVDRPRKAFEPAELADWTSHLCDALDYAHNHARIIHRDLKPSNLMVNQRGDLKVADFGIARSLNESVSVLTMQHGRSGTLLYMSPQQLDGERGSHLDDIYSVGASLYELITSKPPFYFGNIDRQIREKTPARMADRRRELEIEGAPIPAAWEEIVRACLAKDPAKRPQSVTDIARQLEVPSPKTRRGAQELETPGSSRVGLVAGYGIIVLTMGAAAWYSGFLQRPSSPKSVSPAPLTINETRPSPSVSVPIPTPSPTIAVRSPTPTVQPSPSPSPSPTPESRPSPTPVSSAPPKPLVTADAIFEGTIRVKNDNSVNVPLLITIGADLKSGTMKQSGRRGDVVVKFTGVWEGKILRAVTDQVVSTPKGINWQPEAFTLHFADDGKGATYECIADGKTYLADLVMRSGTVPEIVSVYKGVIHGQGETSGGTPLMITLAADRKSGTMTQSSKLGDTVIRFNGIWDGTILRAVTNEVISKPKNIQWKPESFTLRFGTDPKRAAYECNNEGRLYTAQLTAP